MSSCEDFSFGSLEAPAFAVKPTASGEADMLLDAVQAARAEADAIRAEARAEGLAAGRAEALEELAHAAGALSQAAAALDAHVATMSDTLEDEAAALGCALAEKVLAGALSVRPELVVDCVRGALRGVLNRERLTVMVHPEDLALVRDAIGGLADELGGVEHVEVQAERRIGSRGGAIVVHADGDVDARIEMKLERAREVVAEALRP